MNASPILLLGPSMPTLSFVKAAAARARCDLHVEVAMKEANPWLEDHHPPAILVDASAKGARELCEGVRYDPMLANVPVVGISDDISELPFEEMFSSGGDDLCTRDATTIARRLRHLITAGEVPLSRRRGTAVVADLDRRSRVLTARALRNAGYGVQFAVSEEQAVKESLDSGVELVVWRAHSDGSADANAEPAPAKARALGCKAPWVVGVDPKDIGRARAATSAIPHVAVYDAFGPPENVLFVANDLMSRGGKDARASARLLYGTTVQFRQSGGDEDEIGYSYNLSAGGLYVRTLAPPARGSEVWLEMRPPRSDRRVRIEGKVVWTRGFGPNDSATVPPGFGVQITGGSLGDLERYARGYQTFAAELLG